MNMDELEKLDVLIGAIDRQQQINGVEMYLQETLSHEKLAKLTRKLASIERVIDPTSAEEIEENNSKRLAILESYMDELENSLPDATEEDLSYFLFEMELSEEGVWEKYEQEQSCSKIYTNKNKKYVWSNTFRSGKVFAANA
jgi:hypothetical protein